MGITDPTHIMRAIKKKYRVLGIKIDDLMKDEKTYLAEMEEKKKQPPPEPPMKEYIQMDKLFPLLTPMEQMQILMELDIKPDPRRSQMPPDALPGAGTSQQEGQYELQQAQQKHQLGLKHQEEKHQQSMKQQAQKAILDQVIQAKKSQDTIRPMEKGGVFKNETVLVGEKKPELVTGSGVVTPIKPAEKKPEVKPEDLKYVGVEDTGMAMKAAKTVKERNEKQQKDIEAMFDDKPKPKHKSK